MQNFDRMRIGLAVVALACFACLAGELRAQADACGDATPIALDEMVRGRMSATTQDGEGSCGLSARSADVWYRFTAPESCFLRGPPPPPFPECGSAALQVGCEAGLADC